MSSLKKVFSVFLVVVILFTFAPMNGFVGLKLPSWRLNETFGTFLSYIAHAEDMKEGVFTFRPVDDDSAIIVKVDSDVSGSLKIPSEIGGYSVVEIASESFRECEKITSLEIPDSVISIGNYAFANCVSLTSVDLGTGVQTMGCAVFMNDVKLTEIVVPASLKNCNGTGWISLYPDTDYSNSYSNVGTFGGSYIKTAT
ncbi:MAG: leucine-rich repeat domain-containing protein, partial [Clostridia bacterium]|nr:leucine-rich repeat domain-containing protein [Clostridia bacterium]